MSIFSLTPSQIEALLLIFVRVCAICFTAPVLSSPRIPVYVRAGLSLLIAFLLRPMIAPAGPAVSDHFYLFALLIMREAMLGILLGFTANLVFLAVQMAGEMQDVQAGFGFAGVVDPNVSSASAILGQFQMVLMWLIFLTVNGHHVLLRAVVDSFSIIPLGDFTFSQGIGQEMAGMLTALMLIALRICAPVIAAVLLTDLAMGILQRTAPQLNLLAVGFQAKIAVAIIVLSLALPLTIGLQRGLVPYMNSIVQQMLLAGR